MGSSPLSTRGAMLFPGMFAGFRNEIIWNDSDISNPAPVKRTRYTYISIDYLFDWKHKLSDIMPYEIAGANGGHYVRDTINREIFVRANLGTYDQQRCVWRYATMSVPLTFSGISGNAAYLLIYDEPTQIPISMIWFMGTISVSDGVSIVVDNQPSMYVSTATFIRNMATGSLRLD